MKVSLLDGSTLGTLGSTLGHFIEQKVTSTSLLLFTSFTVT